MCKKKVSVVIPAKNEPYVETLKQRVHKALENLPHEILVQREEGISNAVWLGIQKAKGEVVAVLDADGAHDPRYLPFMIRLLSLNVNVVVATRTFSFYPFSRRIASLFFAWLTRRILGLKLRDPLTAFVIGYKTYMQFENRSGCKFALEIVAHTNKVAEYPIVQVFPKNKSMLNKPLEVYYLLKQLWRLRNEQTH